VALSLKDENTIVHEFGNLAQIAEHYPKMVASLTAFEGASCLGISTFSLRNFLLNI
jgi:hypothetical protein